MIMIRQLTLAACSTFMLAQQANACETPSLQIVMQRLADSLNYACKCEKGTVLLGYPMIHRTAMLRGFAKEFPDNRYVQDNVKDMNAVERGQSCNTIMLQD